MSIGINASAKVDEVLVDKTIPSTGTIEFDIPRTTQDYPLHTVFCIDKSGSMRRDMDAGSLEGILKNVLGDGNTSGVAKMDVAKAGLKKAVDTLSSDDSFAVVAFSNRANTVVNATSGGRTRNAKSDIGKISPSGGTNIKKGLQNSRRLLRNMPSQQSIEWIVLISDGEGTTPSKSELQRQFDNEGITIQSAGIGDYTQETMRMLSQETQGELEHIKSAKQLQKFFKNQIQKARNVAAKDVELKITPGDDVSINEVYYTFSEQQSTVDPEWRSGECIIDLGDINSKSPPKVKFEMEITASEPDLEYELLSASIQADSGQATDTVTVVADKPRGVEPVEEQINEVRPTPDAELILQKISTLGQKGNIREARSVLNNNQNILSSKKYQEAKRRLSDYEKDDSGESAYRLSTLSSDLEE